MCLPSFTAVVLCAGLAAAAIAADAPPRYVGVLSDGTRIEGQQLGGWASPGETPKLDAVELFNAQWKLRWLRDRTLPAFGFGPDSSGFVEFINGDRMPGQVVGFAEAGGRDRREPPHLVVNIPKLAIFQKPDLPGTARILPRAVRRIILGQGPGRSFEPGTLFFNDGSRLLFRGIRWDRDAVKVLLEDGVRRVPLADLAELHLPRADPWRTYLEELAWINPDCSARLVRLETTRGLVVTASESGVRPAGIGGNQANWLHAVQPAWCLDSLWVPLATIRAWCYFAPHEVPLSRLPPSRFVARPMLGEGWSWCADGNVEGGLLENAAGPHGWGFGVHAPCELWFDLPPSVQALRTRVGLDLLAGGGGCARAAVYLNSSAGTPLYQSKHLIGSLETVDAGQVPLPGGQSLVLVADPADRDRPGGADPLDIRDTLDWIEPVLVLDPARMKADVRRAIAGTVAAWDGWIASVEGGMLEGRARFVPGDGGVLRASRGVGTEGRVLTLTTQCEITDSEGWLWVRVAQWDDDAKRGRFEVRVDDRPVARFDVPAKTTSFYVPLERYDGQQVKVELRYQPGDAKEQLDWQAVGMSDRYRQTQWTSLTPRESRSLSGCVLKAQGDSAVLASGALPANDVYIVTSQTEMPEINAFRVEALMDDSLPRQGPGRSATGKFVLSRFSVATLPQGAQPVSGRYVRVEAVKPAKSPLALAEVQVFGGRENLAPRGKAAQSSTEGQAVAGRAIDHNTAGLFTANSFSQTKFAEAKPWWELDLGGVKRLDRVVLWYPSDRTVFHDYRNFCASVLDGGRKVVWKRLLDDPTGPCDELLMADGTEIPVVQHNPRQPPPGPSVKPPRWQQPWTTKKGGMAGSAVYVPTQSVDPRGKVLVFTLRQFAKEPEQLLGRFRISATSEKPPFALEPSGVDVPLLP